MFKITRYSLPVVLAGLVLTGRTQDTTTQTAQERTQEQLEQQRRQLQQQQQRLEQQRQQLEQPRQQLEQSREQLEQQQERLQKQQNQSQEQQQQQQQQISQEQRNQQSTFEPGKITQSQLRKEVTDVNKASSFIGMAVKNLQNEDLGKVNDLVFSPEQGKISYAVLSIGGVLGVGDKLIAVPVTSLKPQPGQNFLVLNMQKSQIQSAPGLAQNNWPNLDAFGVGGAAGSESGTSPDATSSSQGTSPSGTSGTTDSSSKPQGSSPSSSSDSSSSSSDTSSSDKSSSNSDSSSSSKSTDTSATQGETKKSDQ